MPASAVEVQVIGTRLPPSFIFITTAVVEAAGVEYTPDNQIRSVRPMRSNVPVGTLQLIIFWSVVTAPPLVVTGVTFVHCHAPVGELFPIALTFHVGVFVES